MHFSGTVWTSLVAQLRAILPELEAVYVYGSTATGRDTPHSDVDIAVLAETPLPAEALFSARQACESVLRRDVDLVDLRRASTVLQFQVLKDGVMLHGQASRTAAEFEVFILRSYEDLQIRRRGLVQDIVQRGTVYA